ncbi:MAG: cob(I)yrinic acid a,c-diamide adenosyltransferase [Pseudonocardiales bacterium]
MAVHLTRIYTRTGDDGTSGLGDFTRVPKTDLRLAAYADVEEANAAVGAVLALGSVAEGLAAELLRIQNELFDVGADLCVPISPETSDRLRITQAYVDRLESACDRYDDALAPLTSFILPGGSPAAAVLHVARTVARRAERSIWALIERDASTTSALTATYVNRLSDLLFILCRVANDNGKADVLWQPGG